MALLSDMTQAWCATFNHEHAESTCSMAEDYIFSLFDHLTESYDPVEVTRKRFLNLVDYQEKRCTKPHFGPGNYPDRAAIESWNNGVKSLAKQIRESFG